MEEKFKFVQLLFNDLQTNMKEHIRVKKQVHGGGSYWSAAYMNKNYGKTALKRKIVYLRQELLNLEKMLGVE